MGKKFGFSWKRASGISAAKGRLSRKIGIPLTKSGRRQKFGRLLRGAGGSSGGGKSGGGGGCCGCLCAFAALAVIAAILGPLFQSRSSSPATQNERNDAAIKKHDTPVREVSPTPTAANELAPTPSAITPAAPQDELSAQKRAIALYPALGVSGSPLNVEFVKRYREYQRTRPEYFKNADWPTQLAKEIRATPVIGPSLPPSSKPLPR